MEYRLTNSAQDGSRIYLTWRDGYYQLECTGSPEAMTLRIYRDGTIVAEDPVRSAEEAYQRGRELWGALERGLSKESA